MFWCPGCCRAHGSRWSWNGDPERPTFEPSILVQWHQWDGDRRIDWVCHSFVREAQIQFLGDCTHPLAGQTVPLPPFP